MERALIPLPSMLADAAEDRVGEEMIGVEVKTSAAGPHQTWGWVYPPTHPPLRDGRVLRYWVNAAQYDARSSGVAIIIRRTT